MFFCSHSRYSRLRFAGVRRRPGVDETVCNAGIVRPLTQRKRCGRVRPERSVGKHEGTGATGDFSAACQLVDAAPLRQVRARNGPVVVSPATLIILTGHSVPFDYSSYAPRHPRIAGFSPRPTAGRIHGLDHTGGCTTTGGEPNGFGGRAPAGLGSIDTWHHSASKRGRGAPCRGVGCLAPRTAVLAVHQ